MGRYSGFGDIVRLLPKGPFPIWKTVAALLSPWSGGMHLLRTSAYNICARSSRASSFGSVRQWPEVARGAAVRARIGKIPDLQANGASALRTSLKAALIFLMAVSSSVVTS